MTTYKAAIAEVHRHTSRWAVFQLKPCESCNEPEGLALVLGFDDHPSHLRCQCGAAYLLKESKPAPVKMTVDGAMVERARAAMWGDDDFVHPADQKNSMRAALVAALEGRT